ncbi:hypothetical protein G7046_g8559 [Stylonectria norvegica]|nr:hypothetical protein G7046_g8559 [Stylonectria norvegica]
MISSPDCKGVRSVSSIRQLLILTLAIGLLLQGVSGEQFPSVKHNWQAQFMNHKKRDSPAKRGPPQDWEGKVPLVVTNRCDSKIWPGIATQSGTGPGTGGFELAEGQTKRLWVSPNWQGRIWGRTNCTVNGDSCACKTGDCFKKLSCEFSGATPATLAEFNLAGGINSAQTFYDISLVDGYNLPIGINYIPAKNTTFIPPNLTNCACIATAGWIYSSSSTGTYYTNSSFPVPLEMRESNDAIRRWCPWPYLAFPPTKPGDGIYPYPDDYIQRPDFAPCNSACAATGEDKECCVGKYHDPKVCKPSDYSRAAKAMCPDAYSYAFDDQKSTFIIPTGGGWEIVMCPKGRSTNILRQLGDEIFELASSGRLSDLAIRRLMNVTYIESDKSAASGLRPMVSALLSTVLVVALWISL